MIVMDRSLQNIVVMIETDVNILFLLKIFCVLKIFIIVVINGMVFVIIDEDKMEI